LAFPPVPAGGWWKACTGGVRPLPFVDRSDGGLCCFGSGGGGRAVASSLPPVRCPAQRRRSAPMGWWAAWCPWWFIARPAGGSDGGREFGLRIQWWLVSFPRRWQRRFEGSFCSSGIDGSREFWCPLAGRRGGCGDSALRVSSSPFPLSLYRRLPRRRCRGWVLVCCWGCLVELQVGFPLKRCWSSSPTPVPFGKRRSLGLY
jgi:hypothetical protein